MLHGRFESAADQLTFYDDAHYLATARPCPTGEAECTVHGSYDYDPAAHSLRLTDETNRKTTTAAPFAATSAMDPSTGEISAFRWGNHEYHAVGTSFQPSAYDCTLRQLLVDGRLVDVSTIDPALSDRYARTIKTTSDPSGHAQFETVGMIDGRPRADGPAPLTNGMGRPGTIGTVVLDDNMLRGDAGTITYRVEDGSLPQPVGSFACEPATAIARSCPLLPPSDDGPTVSGVHLRRASGLPFKVSIVDGAGNELPQESGESHLKITFEPRSRCDWYRLKQAYGASDDLQYIPGRTYELTDFAPPVVQATVRRSVAGRDFRFGAGRLEHAEASDVQLESGANCWNAAYEFLRATPDRAEFYLPDEERFMAALNAGTQDIKGLTQANMNDANAFAGIERADLILVEATDWTELLHITTVLDEGVLYEKPGPGENQVVRLVTWGELTREYTPAAVKARFTVKRPTTKDWHHPEDAFADATFPLRGAFVSFGIIHWIHPVPYIVDPQTGIHSLAADALSESAMTPSPDEASYFASERAKHGH